MTPNWRHRSTYALRLPCDRPSTPADGPRRERCTLAGRPPHRSRRPLGHGGHRDRRGVAPSPPAASPGRHGPTRCREEEAGTWAAPASTSTPRPRVPAISQR